MSELQFLSRNEVLEIQRRNIDEFGGIHGLRDESAFESALMAAQNRAHYEGAGLAVCAATYAFHLSQAHAFLDGNKRIAAATSEIFVELNGGHLTASNEEIVELFLSIAAGAKTRDDVEAIFAEWLILPTP